MILHAICDTDHYLVMAEVWERLSVSKQGAQEFDVERSSLKKLSELEVRKCQIKNSNRFAYLENLNDNKGINRAWENINENLMSTVCVS
jgi:hypothetical protein